MASAMRKMAVYLGLVEDEGRYDDYDRDHRYDRYDADGRYDDGYDIDDEYDADDDGDSRPAGGERHASGSHSMAVHDRHQRSERPERGGVATLADRRPGPAPVTPAPAPTSARGLDRITTIHPRTYNEAKQIGESFRSGTPVIMNLTDMDDADAKRLVDFAAGLVFGLRGTIERVTAKVFLLSPANVTVTAEAKARMAESGFFNQS